MWSLESIKKMNDKAVQEYRKSHLSLTVKTGPFLFRLRKRSGECLEGLYTSDEVGVMQATHAGDDALMADYAGRLVEE